MNANVELKDETVRDLKVESVTESEIVLSHWNGLRIVVKADEESPGLLVFGIIGV